MQQGHKSAFEQEIVTEMQIFGVPYGQVSKMIDQTNHPLPEKERLKNFASTVCTAKDR